MIRNTVFALVTSLVLVTSALNAQEKSQTEITITFLANEGFLLKSTQHAVLIDAFVAEPYSIYGSLPATVKVQMEAGEVPFERVQLALVSHQHRDHFQPKAALKFLEKHPETLFVSSPEVVAGLLTEAGPDHGLKQRIREVWPKSGETIHLEHEGIQVEFLKLKHGGRFNEIQNLGHVIHLDGKQILHIGDADTAPKTFAAYGLGQKELDIALIPSWFFTQPSSQALDKHLLAKTRIACHISPNGLAETRRALAEKHPAVLVFESALESHRF